MKKIISIDGGGIRGIIPGQVLAALENKLQLRAGDPEVRLSSFFDFFAGTSSGAILTCLLLCPDKNDPVHARYSADEAIRLYMDHGPEIFRTSWYRSLFNYQSIFHEKYPAFPLENILKDHLEDVRLSELLKPCLITAYDIQERKAHFFASHDFAKKGGGGDFLVRDVCRATSAAPTYFKVALTRSLSGVSYPLLDGGMFANNPALCAYSEVRNAIDAPDVADMLLISLGTGSENRRYDYQEALGWGAMGWIKPSIDIMMSGVAETTDYHLRRIFASGGYSSNYIRIQPEYLRNANPEMDDADPENIQALFEVGVKTAEDHSDLLDSIVDRVFEDKDMLSFG